ncbi:ADP-ribose pyrophosphatase YjhB (NUDIX family) [Nonomuraea fuscirosea]|uniref:ADP-ribose pyrophosphatase YjhB (NUDIX family) n=1 Tax=Nonomuraea fuscirosea TaxID=1291556 RepID=A0A2T0LZR4_9ACTN|nr:NUDIX domain-containing protein [Nonomuraea fuscirosea]PRX49696.1 ADP-ribose pyrophosphatase YjhB (NUDIX family) [Nonomuraea fuscirosea]
MTRSMHSVSVAGIVVDDTGRALLTRRADNGEWQAPGGVLEIGETIPDGVRREVLEETGLIVEPLALTGVYKNMTVGVVALVFRCKATGGQLIINDEVTAFRWASEPEIRDMVTEAFAVRILDALHEGAPAIRHHDGINLM